MPIKNDTAQPIQFVICGNVYTYRVTYPKSHYGSFINDLINFGMDTKEHQIFVRKSVHDWVVSWWEYRNYEIKKVQF